MSAALPMLTWQQWLYLATLPARYGRPMDSAAALAHAAGCARCLSSLAGIAADTAAGA